MAVMNPGLFALPLALMGSDAQKNKYLPSIVSGPWAKYTAALIEPRFDFDPNDLRTLAVEDGKGYLLTGEKTFVPYAAEADAILVYARKTGQTASLDGLTQGFIIPKGTPGLEIGERQKTPATLPLYSVRLN
jgi:alkylation response protein AidB-like acyl-CoA dehydrogenase